MKRSNEETRKLVEELFDELARNYVINILWNRDEQEQIYIIKRIYETLYSIDNEND